MLEEGFFTAEVSRLSQRQAFGSFCRCSVDGVLLGRGGTVRFLRLDVWLRCRRRREEWSLVVRCLHHPVQCFWGWSDRIQGLWRELCLVESLVMAMGASDVWNSSKRVC